MFTNVCYFQIMCTFGLIFWSVVAIPSPTKCAGVYEEFGFQETSVQRLILNRVTPCLVEPQILSSLNICKFHKVNMSNPRKASHCPQNPPKIYIFTGYMLYLWKSSIYSKFQLKESCNKQTCVYFVDAAI